MICSINRNPADRNMLTSRKPEEHAIKNYMKVTQKHQDYFLKFSNAMNAGTICA